MSKPLIVIADEDEGYLASLELKFVEEFSDKVSLEIITEKEYFEKFFAVPRTVEILVISEEFYQESLQRHNISNLFLLSETPVMGEATEYNIHRIFKYTSPKDIFNEMMHISQSEMLQEEQKKKETQVIVSYSAVGGAGKTTVALGLAAHLAEGYNRVLYIDAEYIQNFQYFLKNQKVLAGTVAKDFKEENEKIYFNIKKHIATEKFDYVPPFCAALPSLNIRYSAYRKFIEMAKESKDYDFIVVDVDSVLNDEKAELLGIADKVLMIVKQDAYSVYKMGLLLENIDCRDKDKYCFICNAYDKDQKNAILEEQKLFIHQYIERIENPEEISIEKLMSMEALHKLAYMLG